MILRDDYFGKMSHQYAPSEEVIFNAETLLTRVNALCVHLGIKPKVNSGWRPKAYNATVPGAAVNSKHITGQAIDLADPEGELDDILFKDQTILEKHQLFMEHPASTKGWCHLQSVAPRSGNRVFFP